MPILRALKRGAFGAIVATLLLWGGGGDYRPSALEVATAPYGYDLLRWEASNFFDKWLRKLGGSLPWSSSLPRNERVVLAEEYFRLSEEERSLERELLTTGGEDAALRGRTEELRQRRLAIQPVVEETIESEIAAILVEEGFASRTGLVFPPVDTVFESSPSVLVLSPRDRIFRQETTLLKPGIDDREREALEDLVFQDRNLSALVENTGGVAVYPSVVSPYRSLRDALVTTAHEWLHHWFFFRPLGQHYWDSPDMTTLNETAATLGGQAIGDRAFATMTGEVVERAPPDERSKTGPGAFDFRAEMRDTRLHTEELLAEARIEEAEAYMDERRRLMVENGYNIRKINQAYFAFHGSYATSAASVSPIDGQLRGLLERSESLREFLRRVAGCGSYGEFLSYTQGARLERSFSEAPAYRP